VIMSPVVGACCWLWTHLYEFVVPMVPPSWNERDRVMASAAALTDAATLLDGHHKMQAAAETARPLRLLSLLATDAGLAAPEQVAELAALRAAPPLVRSRTHP
jgi:hypothetical protein